MVTTVISTDTVSELDTFVFNLTQDALMILPGASYVVSGEKAVTFASGVTTTYLVVDGTLANGGVANETALLPRFSFLSVGETGIVRGISNSGFATVIMGADLVPYAGSFGGATVRNAGQITNEVGAALEVRGTAGRVDNSGTISGGTFGLLATDGGGFINNSGSIMARFGSALVAYGTTSVVNDGLISNMTARSLSPAVELVGRRYNIIIS